MRKNLLKQNHFSAFFFLTSQAGWQSVNGTHYKCSMFVSGELYTRKKVASNLFLVLHLKKVVLL